MVTGQTTADEVFPNEVGTFTKIGSLNANELGKCREEYPGARRNMHTEAALQVAPSPAARKTGARLVLNLEITQPPVLAMYYKRMKPGSQGAELICAMEGRSERVSGAGIKITANGADSRGPWWVLTATQAGETLTVTKPDGEDSLRFEVNGYNINNNAPAVLNLTSARRVISTISNPENDPDEVREVGLEPDQRGDVQVSYAWRVVR